MERTIHPKVVRTWKVERLRRPADKMSAISKQRLGNKGQPGRKQRGRG